MKLSSSAARRDPGEQVFTHSTQVLKNAVGRYWRIALNPSLVLFGLVLILSFRVPDFYSSESLIFIQPQRITSAIIHGKSREQKEEMRERLEALVQEILSRQRLRSIIKELQLYPDIDTPFGQELALRKFRKAIEVVPVTSSMGVKVFQTFQLSYSHRNADLAYRVTQKLADSFIEESLVDKRSEVRGTEEFLEAQLDESRKELEITEERVQKFIRANFGKLPSHLDAAIARLENAQAQLATNAQLQGANEARKANLQRELNELTKAGLAFGDVDSGGVDPYESLAQLESALVILLSKYSERHPDVINTRKRITALKEGISQGGKGGKTATSSAGGKPSTRTFGGSSPAARQIRRSIDELNVKLSALEKEDAGLKATVAKLQENIESMPVKEQELLKIKRDYSNSQRNYERLLAAREDAGLQSSLIRSQKGTQFRIIEPAEKPVKPSGPNRYLIVGAGLGLSLIIFFAIPLALYFLNGSYKFTDDLEGDVDVPVIGVIPPMETAESLRFRRRLSSSSMLASLVSLIGGFIIIFLTT